MLDKPLVSGIKDVDVTIHPLVKISPQGTGWGIQTGHTSAERGSEAGVTGEDPEFGGRQGDGEKSVQTNGFCSRCAKLGEDKFEIWPRVKEPNRGST